MFLLCVAVDLHSVYNGIYLIGMHRILLTILLLIGLFGCSGSDYPIYEPVAIQKPSVRWQHYSQSALIASQGANRPAFLYFGLKGCGSCKKMELDTFSDSTVIHKLNASFVPIKIMGDDFNQFQILTEQYHLGAVPSIVILSSVKGTEIFRVSGYVDKQTMILFLNTSGTVNTLMILEDQVINMTFGLDIRNKSGVIRSGN
jgi:thioredoxin-related protein